MSRRQVEIPDVLYHVTKTCNVSGILSEGLIPHKSVGACYNDEIGDSERYGVYLTSEYEALIEIDCSFCKSDGLSVLSIDVSDIKSDLVPDEAFDDDCMFTQEEVENGMYDQFSYIYPGCISASRVLRYSEI